tara:strand:- start:2551 stop:3531 length:981 start_codon:yes stop_codon:yes gene_type:complete
MKIAFLTEMGFEGKIPSNHSNMRTEFAWMFNLNADHHNIHNFREVKGYDHIFVIFPKGRVYLDACGSQIAQDNNPVSELLSFEPIERLKLSNSKVHFIQEGPHWLWNDYSLPDQIRFFNMLASCDIIFAHNEHDVKYYKGLIPNVPVHAIPTLMINSIVENIQPLREDKVIIGGNFARWYGGMESFMVAQRFEVPIWGQTSHAMREGEDQLIQHLPRVMWTDWMNQLSSFKYAVHLMPTVAAGTFSLNCAYFGIPCIGNEKVDTQRLCHPDLAVDVEDVEKAAMLAERLKNDPEFYTQCSIVAKNNYTTYYNEELFKQKINNILSI